MKPAVPYPIMPLVLSLFQQDDSLVGVPSKLNRYKRAGTKAVEVNKNKSNSEEGEDSDKEDVDGSNAQKETAATGIDNSLEESEEEGDVGSGAGLTLIKIRLFKEVKKDEVRGGVKRINVRVGSDGFREDNSCR